MMHLPDAASFATTAANELRVGHIVETPGGQLLEVTKHVYRQGEATRHGHVQVQYRDLRTGQTRLEKLSPSDRVERVNTHDERWIFLYIDGATTNAVLMHPESFEQREMPIEAFGSAAVRAFLHDGCEVTVQFYEGEALGAALPEEVEVEVKSAEPRRDTADKGASDKNATLVTGATVRVPPFVKVREMYVCMYVGYHVRCGHLRVYKNRTLCQHRRSPSSP